MRKSMYVLTFFPLLLFAVFWTSTHFAHFSCFGFLGPYEVVGIAKQGAVSFNAEYEGGLAFQFFPVVDGYDDETEFFAITHPTIRESLVGSHPDLDLIFGGLVPKNILITLPFWMTAFLILSFTLVAIWLLAKRGPNKPSHSSPDRYESK